MHCLLQELRFMRLRIKTFLGISLIWASYLILVVALPTFKFSHTALVIFISGVVLFASTLLWLNHLIFKRLEKLSENINQSADTNKFTDRIKETGSDELTSISKDFNKILDIVEDFDE